MVRVKTNTKLLHMAASLGEHVLLCFINLSIQEGKCTCCTGALPPLSTPSIHPCNKMPLHREPQAQHRGSAVKSDGTQMSWSTGLRD